MMPRMSQKNQHISDLLPAYLNGRLDAASAERVREHLETCGDCRHELSAWEAVINATRLASASMSAPSPMLMNAVWAKIDAQDKAIAQQKSIKRVAYHLWLVFTRQIPLIHKDRARKPRTFMPGRNRPPPQRKQPTDNSSQW